MEVLHSGERQVVRFDPGEEVMTKLKAHLGGDSVGFAFVSAAGGVSRVKLGYWNAETAAYEYRVLEEQLEVLVLQGNASLQEGESHLHLHGVFGRRDFSTVGGHVVEADANPTLELWVHALDLDVRRVKDEGSGLAVLALQEPA